MLASDVIANVRSTLVEPVAGFWTDTELLNWIKRAENDYVNKTRVLDGKQFTSTLPGVSEYPLPSNCLSVRGVMLNDTTDQNSPNWIRLAPTNLEKSMQEFPNFTSVASGHQGSPRRYLVWGRSLYLFPAPDVTGNSNIMLFFKAKPIPQISTASPLNVDDTLAEGVIAYVLWKAYEKENEPEKAEIQRQIYELYVKQGLRWAKRQSGDQRYRLDISSPIPFEGPFDDRYNPLA